MLLKEKFSEAAKGVVPENTKKNNSWVEKTFLAWVEERNKAVPEDPVPIDLLSCHNPTVVCKYLRYFVLEVRSSTGEKYYPPATIQSILSGLNRVMKDRKAPFSILDKSNPSFRELMLTLNSVTSELHRDGVGVSKKSAAVVTFEHEEENPDHPKSLQRAVFYSVSLRFALRVVKEQHDLKLEQLKRYPPEKERYILKRCIMNTLNSSQRTTSIDLRTLTLLTKP